MARIGMTGLALTALFLGGCGQGTEKQDDITQRQEIGQVWKYEEQPDPENGRPIPLAYIGSANSVRTMSAPDTFAVILLQKMRNGETGVTIKAVGAPFACDLSDCSVEASVDGKPATWKGRMTDGKDGIVIPPSQHAFEAISGSRKVQVTLDLGPEGSHPFSFDTQGFTWSR